MPSRRIDKCIDCNRTMKICARNRCSSCYGKWKVKTNNYQREKRACITCGEIEIITAFSKCRKCYERTYRAMGLKESKKDFGPSVCHPERKAVRKYNKICGPCYYLTIKDKLPKRKYTKKQREQQYLRRKELKEKKKAKEGYQPPSLAAKRAGRKAHLKQKYNLSLEDYDILLYKQNNKCAICGKENKITENNILSKGLHVDHCHKTGKVRGLLCYLCNTMIGKAKENPFILISAIKYLNNNGGDKCES